MGNKQFTPDLVALRAAAGRLPVDDVIRLFGNYHARNAVIYLHDHPTATLDELADALAAAAASTDETIATPSDRERIRIRLYHVILPQLEELGIVSFDSEANAVTETTIPAAIREYLRIDDCSA
ncbi:DUF7344 domain-containing protein [Natrinema salaciae]|uniref:DUF7344 domain-containing protein n=1 Tax=Natrinema salaciae TaxID=1186196 RepID=A0A1H9EF46_9EURY|nr:hypothetical protein [Natrinema salaciae]SEQ24376.1 hypothetical protein SAMN04489841_1277 [Natrinema salaciae]